MSLKELGEKLKEMYQNSQFGDSVAMIHLFGIKYADQIIKCGYSKKDIANAAGIQESYATEISKGITVSRYGSIK